MGVKTPDKFLFVPQQSGSSRSHDRRFINTHLSRIAAEQRKCGRGVPKTIKSSRSSPSVVFTNGAKVAIPRFSPETVPTLSLDQTQVVLVQDHDEQPQSDGKAVSEPSNPVTILDNGSHDPFDSTLVPITAEARQLLLFDQQMFYPFIVNMEKGADKDGAFSNKFNYTSQTALVDECVGYATLARIANAAAIVSMNRHVKVMALKYKARAYESLRSSISKNGLHPTEHLLTQMFSLLSMDIAGQEHEDAALHARTLQKLIQIQSCNGSGISAETMNRKLLTSILWHECLRGSLTLCRPAFDLEELVDHTAFLRTLLDCKDQISALGLMPQEPVNGFEQAGIDSQLLMSLREHRFLTRLCHAMQQFPKLINEDYMTAFSFRAILTSNKLLDAYNDANDEIKARQADKSQDLTSAYTEAATALAAVFWCRAATSHEAVDVTPSAQTQMFKIFGTQKTALRYLTKAMEYCTRSGGVAEEPELWLWIMYVASLAERADLHPRCDPEELVSGYFHSALCDQAQSLKITSWDKLEEVLFMFLYARRVGPLSKPLFERAMNRYNST